MQPRLEVVILQHPRERRVAIGTARMVHRALAGSRLVEGIRFDDHPALRDIIADIADVDDVGPNENAVGETVLLFPDDDAKSLDHYIANPPRRLVVVDGTWVQAKKIIQENPWLARLPRLSFSPSSPGRYRIRKEPSDLHLSTVEAVAAVVGAIEGDVEGYQRLLIPFDQMVDQQVAMEAAHNSTEEDAARKRRYRKRRREADPLRELRDLLVGDATRAVVLYGEANAHPHGDRAPGSPELLQLVAARPYVEIDVDRIDSGDSGDSSVDVPTRLSLTLRPRRPLHPTVPERLGVSAEVLEAGDDVASSLRRFNDFLADGRLLSWGPFPRDLLVQEGESMRGFVDLRSLSSRALGGPAGGVVSAHQRLTGTDVDESLPRAEMMLTALVAIARELRRRLDSDPPGSPSAPDTDDVSANVDHQGADGSQRKPEA